jgi:hypothetical protein
MKATASSVWRVFRLPPNTWAFNSTSALWAVGQSMATPYQVVYFAISPTAYSVVVDVNAAVTV